MGDALAGARGLMPDRAAPLALKGRWLGLATGLASLVLVAALSALELAFPGLATLGSLVIIPVLAAAWLLDSPLFLTVAGLALASRVVAWWGGDLDPGTAVAEIAAVLLVGATARIAALSTVQRRDAERRLSEQTLQLARLDERERIAQDIRQDTVKKLFGITLTLQAVGALPPAQAAQRLEEAVAELDQLCADLRHTVFR